MKKPTSTYTPSSLSIPSFIPEPIVDISLQAQQFDELIKNRGLLFTHTHAIPCPHVTDVNSAVHDSYSCTNENCENGFLQVLPKQVWGYYNNDQLNKLFEIQGEYNQNVVVITFSAKYTDGTECDMNIFDRLELVGDYTKRMYERFESSPTGVDRLKYKAIDVEYLISESNKIFTKDVHFMVDNGFIKWIPNAERPQFNQALNRGEICSISYLIRPRYYVNHIMKEIRGSQVLDSATGEKRAVRLPMHVYCVREYLHSNENDEVGNKYSRFPRSGMITPG